MPQFTWKEEEHPRSVIGRFAKKLGESGAGARATLQDGSAQVEVAKTGYVVKDKTGNSRRHADPEAAAHDALSRSARNTGPDSLGLGTQAYRDAEHAAEAHDYFGPSQPNAEEALKKAANLKKAAPRQPAPRSAPEPDGLPKLKKVVKGHYASEDGKWAIQSDGYSPGYLMDPSDLQRGMRPNAEASMGTGGEWALIHDPKGRLNTDSSAGENLDWFPTKGEAEKAMAAHFRRTGSGAKTSALPPSGVPLGEGPKSHTGWLGRYRKMTHEQLVAEHAHLSKAENVDKTRMNPLLSALAEKTGDKKPTTRPGATKKVDPKPDGEKDSAKKLAASKHKVGDRVYHVDFAGGSVEEDPGNWGGEVRDMRLTSNGHVEYLVHWGESKQDVWGAQDSDLMDEKAFKDSHHDITKSYDALADIRMIGGKMPASIALRRVPGAAQGHQRYLVSDKAGNQLGYVESYLHRGNMEMSGNIGIGRSGAGKKWRALGMDQKSVTMSSVSHTTRLDGLRLLGRYHPEFGRDHRRKV